MGASLVYLEKPIKDIDFDEGENDKITFAAGSMQGWRINMVNFATLLLFSQLSNRRIRIFQICTSPLGLPSAFSVCLMGTGARKWQCMCKSTSRIS